MLIEFLLTSLIWMPLLLGTAVFGINLIRAIQVSQLARDAGHMYAYGIDFTSASNLALLERIAAPLGIVKGAGDGGLLLSKITLITQADCTGAGMQVCNNTGKYVYTSLFAFGNPAYQKTQLGSPNPKYFGASIQAAQYLTDGSLVARNFSALLQFPANQSGQYAYVSEVTVNTQSLAWSAFANTGSYARSIF